MEDALRRQAAESIKQSVAEQVGPDSTVDIQDRSVDEVLLDSISGRLVFYKQYHGLGRTIPVDIDDLSTLDLIRIAVKLEF